MQFNSEKCYIMYTTRQRSEPNNFYHLGADMPAGVESYLYLGVTIRQISNGTTTSHITDKASSTRGFYGVMSTTAHVKPNHLLTHSSSDFN